MSSQPVNPMNFTDNQHGNVILEKLKIQKEEGKFCDVHLYVNNKRIKAHRNVLASCSSYFESMLRSKKMVIEQFNISCDNVEAFQNFINYMYTGSIVLDKNNISDMFKLANHFDVVKLKMYCSEYLERYLDLSNCLLVKYLVDHYGITTLSKLTTSFIQTHINDIVNQNQYLQLDVYQMEAFLSDKSLMLEIRQIIEMILHWLKHDINNREKQFIILLKLINWKEINIDFITELIDKEQVFSNSEIALYGILHVLNENCVVLKYQMIYQTLNEKYTGQIFENKESHIKINKKRTKHKVAKSNPLKRLAALRSALLLRKKSSGKLFHQRRQGVKEEDTSDIKCESIFQCHLCDYYSNDATTLEQHLSVVHSRDVTYKCGVCGFVCQWNNTYFDHMKGHFQGPPFKCDTCDFTSDKLQSVLTHRSAHVDEKTHRCSQCGFRCRSQASLLSHAKCHQVQSPPNEKVNPTVTDRAYVCDVCGFNTKYLSHLIAHKRIHSGDVYRCSYPHCKYTTAKKSQLGSHSKSHQGVRPHCCNVCGRGFLEKSHLVRHERIHLEEKPFKCHECDYASSRRDKLKEHQARHHGDNASAKVPYKARPNKKPTQLFGDNFASDSGSRQPQTAATPASNTEIPEVLTHSLTSNNYQAVFNTDHHVATGGTIELHHQQMISTTNGRVKEHVSVASGHRTQTQSTAVAVAAAMMLDPRFHHANTATGPYTAPAVTMATMVGQSTTQGVQSSHHQVPEYPSALMSMF